MKWSKTKLGYEYKTDELIMFFGNKDSHPEKLKLYYPEFDFRFLKQIHGTSCIQSTSQAAEADAHYTDEKNIALCIRTADCTPILLGNEFRVMAIHAGWRGVFHEILPKSLEHLGRPSIVTMGPHIQLNSFEVDANLGNEFAIKFGKEFLAGERHVDLKAILLKQLDCLDEPPKDLWQSDEDTLSNPDYFSHRREPDNTGRNISFVARL